MNYKLKILSTTVVLSLATASYAGSVSSGVDGASGGSSNSGSVTSGVGGASGESSNSGASNNPSPSTNSPAYDSNQINTLGDSPTDSNNPKNPNNLDNAVPNAPSSDN